MARPRKSLLERCCRNSFRPRHHWALIAGELDLPVAALAELQQQARDCDDETQRALAQEFARRLGALSERERAMLDRAREPADRSPQQPQSDHSDEPQSFDARSGGPGPLAARLQTAPAETVDRESGEPTAPRRLALELLLGDVQLLDSTRARITLDGPMLAGSRGQQRAHPLLTHISGLSREISEQLQAFETRVSRRAGAGPTFEELLNIHSTPKSVAPQRDANADH